MLWYQDILRALLHLHALHITHSDLRPDNTSILLDRQHVAILCDFSTAAPFGERNPAFPLRSLPVPLNGLSETVSASTDRFAMSSFIHQMETGSKPEISVVEDGNLTLPCVRTGNTGLDSIVRNGWLGKYASAAQMLADAESLNATTCRDQTVTQPASADELRASVRQWRGRRLEQYGKLAFSTMCQLPNS